MSRAASVSRDQRLQPASGFPELAVLRWGRVPPVCPRAATGALGEMRGDKGPRPLPSAHSLLPPAAATRQCTRLPAPSTRTPRANPEGLVAEGKERGVGRRGSQVWAEGCVTSAGDWQACQRTRWMAPGILNQASVCVLGGVCLRQSAGGGPHCVLTPLAPEPTRGQDRATATLGLWGEQTTISRLPLMSCSSWA